MTINLDIFNTDHFWLKNAHIPCSLLDIKQKIEQTKEGLCLVDLEIVEGKIQQVAVANSQPITQPSLDLQKKIIFPCFIDSHTHLDKGHIWERVPNLVGTFDNALQLTKQDAQNHWQEDDIYRRMEFGLKCSYAHGTIAIRTHLDSFGQQGNLSFKVFQQLQKQWQNKLILQPVSLVSLDYYLSEEGEKLADLVAEYGGILGGVAYMNPDLEKQLDQVFKLAKERNLSLDFHVDENDDPDSICLRKVAETALQHQFKHSIVCGHCCSLAVQNEPQVSETIRLVKQANIGVVSLPMCNLFLQDRKPQITPHWRGVTRVHELNNQGIAVAFASDNCRDPFHGFGDHDGLEVFKEAVKIAHLDSPYENWINSVTKTPATLMGLADYGKIKTGILANFVIFNARYFSELLSRPQSDRVIIRNSKPIDTTLPDYAELDDLI